MFLVVFAWALLLGLLLIDIVLEFEQTISTVESFMSVCATEINFTLNHVDSGQIYNQYNKT